MVRGQKTIHSYASCQVAHEPNNHEETVDDGQGEEGGIVDAGLAQVLHDVGGHVVITLHQGVLHLYSVNPDLTLWIDLLLRFNFTCIPD